LASTAGKVVGWLKKLSGPVARAMRGRVGKLLGGAAEATAIGIAIGAGSELAGIMISEYQLQSLINDLPRAMDDMMKNINYNQQLLDRIKTALLKTRITSALARFTARAGELAGFRFASNWLSAVLIMQQFSILVSEVYKALWDVTIARMQRFSLVDFSDQQYERTGDMAIQNLLNEWQTMSPLEMAQKNLREFIDLQNDLNALATYFDAIGRTSALGHWLGFSALARTVTNISWAFGIGWLSWVAIGPGMRFTIAQPLEKYYNELLRQADLPRETALRLWRKRIISDEELGKRLAILGHPDSDIELLKRDEAEFFSESQIGDMLEIGQISIDEAKEYLERIGWREPELSRRLELLVNQAKASLKNRWVSKLESAYADGLVRLEDINNARAVRLGDVSLDELRNYIVNLELNLSLASLRIKTLQEKFLDGTIDEDTLRTQLSSIVVVPDVLEAMVENLKARKEPRVTVAREETLDKRRRSLENRLETLMLQIRHQTTLRDDSLAILDARRDRLVAERNAQVRRLRELAEARIAAIDDEYNAYAAASRAELEARIRELEAIADAQVRGILDELEIRKRAIDEELEVYRTATEIEIETRIEELRRIAATQTGATQERTLIRIEFLDDIKTLPVLRREALAETRKRRLEDEANARIERIRATTEARIALLREMAEARVEERRARAEALKNRIREETDARIRQIEEETNRRLQELELERAKTQDTYNARIEKLTLQADQVREELDLVNAALAKRAG
jgi:hypothetical protein